MNEIKEKVKGRVFMDLGNLYSEANDGRKRNRI